MCTELWQHEPLHSVRAFTQSSQVRYSRASAQDEVQVALLVGYAWVFGPPSPNSFDSKSKCAGGSQRSTEASVALPQSQAHVSPGMHLSGMSPTIYFNILPKCLFDQLIATVITFL